MRRELIIVSDEGKPLSDEQLEDIVGTHCGAIIKDAYLAGSSQCLIDFGSYVDDAETINLKDVLAATYGD